MDPISPWLDAAEVRRLATQLMMPNEGHSAAAAEDTDFAGGTSNFAIPAPAVELPLPIAEPPTFPQRADRFQEWMRETYHATEIFLLDGDGQLIFDDSSHGRLHFLARSLANKTGGPGGNVRLQINAGSTVELIPLRTENSVVILAAVVPKALSQSDVEAVRKSLAGIWTPAVA